MDLSRLMQLIRAGAVDPWHAARYHGGKGSTPAAPDYRGAAEEQGQASKEAMTEQTWANRPTLTTPWGRQDWTASAGVDPATGQPVTKWASDISLSPEQQAALDAQQDITMGRSEAAKELLGQATEGFKTPFDWGGLPSVPGSVSDAQKSAYETMSAGLEPGRTRQRSALDTRLANMGLGMGSEAYKGAQQDLADQFSLQDKGVMAAAMGEGRADIGAQQGLRGAAIAEQAQKRGMTLNELNALLTGQQVNMPQMPGFSQAGVAQTPNLLDAANMQGNFGLQQAQMKQQQGAQTGQLLGSAAMVGAMMF